MTWGRILARLAGVAILAAPGLAVACPQCAAREGAGLGGLLLLGGMILSPFVVSFFTWRWIRRISSPAGAGVLAGSEYGGQA